jgi:hypothetical protein
MTPRRRLDQNCRVEERRGSLGLVATLRFLSPLVEPDRPRYGIRLSDKASDLRAWKTMNKRLQLHESQGIAKILMREAACSRIGNLVLVA